MPTPDDELVRRLLADARHDEPMPTEVAARLDRVLDGLRPAAADGTTPLPSLRRRRWATGLVAAAAVVLAGVAGTRLLPTGSDSTGSDSADSAADSASLSEEAGGSAATTPSPGQALPPRLRAAYRALGVEAPPTTWAVTCDPPGVGRGTASVVKDGDEPALLVLRPREGATRVADLLSCDTGEVIRSTTLPAR